MLFLDAGSAWGRGLGKLAMQLCRSWWKAQEIAPRWTLGTVVGSWWQLMAVDSSCQAVLEVQAQDLICLSPCQSGEDCLGLTAKTPRPDLLLLGFHQIPLPSDSIGMSRDQVKWLCVYLALCLNSWKCLSALLCCPVLGALTSPLNIINVAQVFILFRLSFGDGEPVMFDGRHEALAVAKQRGLSQELQLFQRLSKWPSCVTACKKETGKIEKHSRGRRSI